MTKFQQLKIKKTSRQINQTFEEFLQQVRVSGQGFNYKVPMIYNTKKYGTTSLGGQSRRKQP